MPIVSGSIELYNTCARTRTHAQHTITYLCAALLLSFSSYAHNLLNSSTAMHTPTGCSMPPAANVCAMSVPRVRVVDDVDDFSIVDLPLPKKEIK